MPQQIRRGVWQNTGALFGKLLIALAPPRCTAWYAWFPHAHSHEEPHRAAEASASCCIDLMCLEVYSITSMK